MLKKEGDKMNDKVYGAIFICNEFTDLAVFNSLEELKLFRNGINTCGDYFSSTADVYPIDDLENHSEYIEDGHIEYARNRYNAMNEISKVVDNVVYVKYSITIEER